MKQKQLSAAPSEDSEEDSDEEAHYAPFLPLICNSPIACLQCTCSFYTL
jgi:hypothetical protein